MTVYTVTGTGDTIAVDGIVTLREAIQAAASNVASGDAPAGGVGLDTINFAIPGVGIKTINITTALPALNNNIIIDGWSQGGVGYNGSPLIELNGTGTPFSTAGLVLNGSSNAIRGLTINRFAGDGVFISGSNNALLGNYIGTNAAGTAAAPNGFHGVQVFDGSANNTIGSGIAADRNVISGNSLYGIILEGAVTDFNSVLGNFIGTNAAGSAKVGNGIDGILIYRGAQGNFIGNSLPAGANIISGNGQHGVFIQGDATDGNIVQNNFIGTDVTGNIALGNALDGVPILDADNSIVRFNTISGNGRFGVLLQFSATNTIVSANVIGASASGTPLGNTNPGVAIFNGATVNNITSNTIAFNRVGVGFNAAGVGNSISQNSIFSNTGLGIDLNLDGVTANDLGDPDTGSNNLQNFPLLSPITDNGIIGTLNSLANTQFSIQFFASTTADPSGNGEGETFIGTQTVTTDASGNANFNFGTVSSPGKPFITATATRLGLGVADTSEFSNSVVVEVVVPTPMLVVNRGAGVTALGSSNADVYSAPDSNDIIIGFAGDDRFFGRGGNDSIDGGAGNDSLSGGTGNDTIIGNIGNDSLRGDGGADVLIGGIGNDLFVYNVATDGGDTIADFDPTLDSLSFSLAGFGGGLIAGLLPASQFLLGSSVATNPTQRFIYDGGTGILRFDADGSGVGASSIVASLTGNPLLSNANIVIF